MSYGCYEEWPEHLILGINRHYSYLAALFLVEQQIIYLKTTVIYYCCKTSSETKRRRRVEGFLQNNFISGFHSFKNKVYIVCFS